MNFLTELGFSAQQSQWLFVLCGAFVIIIAALFAVLYVLNGIALSRMAKTSNIGGGWFGFFPVLNQILIGRLGGSRKRTAVFAVTYVFYASLMIVSLVKIAYGSSVLINAAFAAQSAGTALSADAFTALLGGAQLLLITAAVAIVYKVIKNIALFSVYASFDRKNTVKYLVFGVIFDFLIPVFLFAASRKEEHNEQ